MCDENWNVDDCRTKFESSEHWALKKEFINAHKGKFRKERLLCLAQLFVNIQILRCKYPDEITRQVLELSKGIGQDYKTKQKERLQRTFVPASEAACAKVRGEKPCFRSLDVSKISTSSMDHELYTNQEDSKAQEFFIAKRFPNTHEISNTQQSPRPQELSKIQELPRTQDFPNIQEFSKTQDFPNIQEISRTQVFPNQQFPRTQDFPNNQEFSRTQNFPNIQEFPKTLPNIQEFPKTLPNIQEFPRTQDFQNIQEFPRTQDFQNIQEFSRTQDFPNIQEFPRTQDFPNIQEFSKIQELPLIKENFNQEAWWNDECAKAVQEKKRCYRRLQRNRHNADLLPQLKAEYHQAKINAQRILRNVTKGELLPSQAEIPSTKETSESSMSCEAERVSTSSQRVIELSSKINFIKGAPLPTTVQVPSVNTETSSEEQVKSKDILKKENLESLAVVISPKVAENPQPQAEISDDNLEMDYECPFMPNLFLILERFATFHSYIEFLKSSAQISRFQLSESFITEKSTAKIVCTLARQYKNGTIPIGVGKDLRKKGSKENAAKEAVKMLLQKCYTIEIKKRAAGEEEISLEELGCPSQNTYGLPDNAGTRIMKLMGWTGGPLGLKGQGIREPIQALAGLGRLGIGLRVPVRPKVIGRQYLGVMNEYHPSLTFHNAITKLLDQMMDSLRTQPDEVIPDLVFSSELSNFQRKHVHETIREDYSQLKSISYGQAEDRFLVVKPKISCENLFHRISYQGGYTEKYVIHKPGTLTMEDIKKRDENL